MDPPEPLFDLPGGPPASDPVGAVLSVAGQHGRALLKVISPNNVGATGSHESGFYLPKSAWRVFAPSPPEDGVLRTWPVTIRWPDGRLTQSAVKWYGQRTRSEYRLTRFGRGFPYLTDRYIGALLVLVPTGTHTFDAFVLEGDDEIEEVQASLGVGILRSFAVFERDAATQSSAGEACLESFAGAFAEKFDEFPSTARLALAARESVGLCVPGHRNRTVDQRLLDLVDSEYRLFRAVERRLFAREREQAFANRSVEEFLSVAQTYLQRRKARAGRSLEHHAAHLLTQEGVQFEAGAVVEETRPDILIPGKAAYLDPRHPKERLWMLGIKTSCRDRWRQVRSEAPRLLERHILTLQQGVSESQMREMDAAGVKLVVPEPFHDQFPPSCRARLLTLRRFVAAVRDGAA